MTKCLVMVYINADDVLANFAVDSLNQLKRAVDKAAGSDISVRALFDQTGRKGPAKYYSWDSPLALPQGDFGSPVALPRPGTLGSPVNAISPGESDAGTNDPFRDVNLTDVQTLITFVNLACGEPKEWEDRRHCLIFWGHGTELLLDQEPDGIPRYLTPAKLRAALEGTKIVRAALEATQIVNRRKKGLDIVAFDACNMSMIELASELQGCADYMIASQEDVPDASFPYDYLLPQLRGMDVIKICREVTKVYKESFQDHLFTPGNGMKQTTLSSLQLANVSTITNPLKNLVDALRTSIADPQLVGAIIEARENSRDFVLGIFVDLSDFCENLAEQLQNASLTQTGSGLILADACKSLRDAISNGDGADACVIANETGKKGRGVKGVSHGVSIYFPYSVQKSETELSERLLGKDQTGVVSIPFVKGTRTNQSKGTRTNQSKSAVIEVRIQRIQELEADFAELKDKDFSNTGWLDFITTRWSVILASKFPDDLDLHYSAQQCVKNLLPKLPGPSSSSL